MPLENSLNEIERGLQDMLKSLNLNEEAVSNTPQRVIRAYMELWRGLFEEKPAMSAFKGEAGQKIIIDDIQYTSTCEHHLMLFKGSVRIEFISEGLFLGLSKYNRLVQWLAARPTLQEHLCSAIYNELKHTLKCKNLRVTVTGEHSCVSARGIKDACSNTTVEMGAC